MATKTRKCTTRPAAPQPTETERLQCALERFDFLEEHGPLDWPGQEDLRSLAEALGVPYLMLLLHFYSYCGPQEDLRSLAEALGVPYLMLLLHFYSYCGPAVVTLDDIDQWTAAPHAHLALTDFWARTRRAVA